MPSDVHATGRAWSRASARSVLKTRSDSPQRAGLALPAFYGSNVGSANRIVTRPEHVIHSRVPASKLLDGHAEPTPLARPGHAPKLEIHDDLLRCRGKWHAVAIEASAMPTSSGWSRGICAARETSRRATIPVAVRWSMNRSIEHVRASLDPLRPIGCGFLRGSGD